MRYHIHMRKQKACLQDYQYIHSPKIYTSSAFKQKRRCRCTS